MKAKRGRPPLDRADQSVHVSLRMPSQQYDHLCTCARRDTVTVSEMMRRQLQPKNVPLKSTT